MTGGHRAVPRSLAAALALASWCVGQGGEQDIPPDPVELEKQGKIDEATSAWLDRIQREPDNAAHRLAVIEMLVRAKRPDKAVSICDAAIDKFAKHYDLNLVTAKVYQLEAERISRARGNANDISVYLTDSTVFAEDAKALRPDAREPRALLALALLQLRRNEEAQEEIDELVRRFPDHPGGYILRGNLLIADYRAAVRGGANGDDLFKITSKSKVAFTAAIRLDPGRVGPYRRLGDLAAWQNQADLALDHYAKGLARDPVRGAPLPWVYQNLAAGERLGYFQAIVVEAKRLGTSAGPVWASLFWYSGLAAFETQDWTVARALMQRTRALEPSFTNTHLYASLCWYNEGKHNEATIELAKLAQKSPEALAQAIQAGGRAAQSQASIVSFLARRAHDAGVLAVSRDLNHALALYTKSAFDWNNYAFLCRETQRFEESYVGYTKALAIAPNDPAILNDCAVILQYHLHRDLDKARKLYEKALREGARVLASKGADQELQRAAAQAIADATSNLAKLGK